MHGESVAVVVSERATKLERFAAAELCRYLEALFGIITEAKGAIPARADHVFRVGVPSPNGLQPPGIELPPLSEQTILLRPFEQGSVRGIMVGGGSPAAALWAVYRLVEEWGVRFLLHGDKLPARRPFAMPTFDLVAEPLLPVRAWRVINDFAGGPESWGMADYRPVLDQLAKLTFNRILISLWPYQPFLHYALKGARRNSAYLWFDEHYPITDDMVGRELFGDAAEFWNPDLPMRSSYEEFAAAGEKLVHSLMAHAHGRGMEAAVTVPVLEFMPEFAPLLKDWRKVRQLKELTIVPGAGMSVDDPDLAELSACVLRAAVDTYPEADYLSLSMPEFRQWTGEYERAWKALDEKYAIERERPLDEIVAAARRRAAGTDYMSRASERALDEVKGDIVMLYYYDRLLTERRALEGTRRPDMKFLFTAVAEELYPVVAKVVPPGSELVHFVDYTPRRILARRRVLRDAPTRDLPNVLIHTLHDDNVGVVPQLETAPIHELMLDLRRYGWAGFQTRYWLIGDHDPCVAYLARAAWDAEATPDDVYADQIGRVCGESAVAAMREAFRLVEEATGELEMHALGFTFAVPGMLMKHWTPEPIPPELKVVREKYRRAEDLVRAAHDKSSSYGGGLSYTGYWINRLAFGRLYIDAIEAVRGAARAEAEGRSAGASNLAREALAIVRRALEAFARATQDRSDLGTLAVLNEYVYRPLKDKASALHKAAKGDEHGR